MCSTCTLVFEQIALPSVAGSLLTFANSFSGKPYKYQNKTNLSFKHILNICHRHANIINVTKNVLVDFFILCFG